MAKSSLTYAEPTSGVETNWDKAADGSFTQVSVLSGPIPPGREGFLRMIGVLRKRSRVFGRKGIF